MPMLTNLLMGVSVSIVIEIENMNELLLIDIIDLN